jgi:hypothetical protein
LGRVFAVTLEDKYHLSTTAIPSLVAAYRVDHIAVTVNARHLPF